MTTQNGDKCILIYEDDPEIQLLCKTILQKNNFRVETRTRCENVLSDIVAIKPDVVLMDLWIPEIGGEKAISLIKSDPRTNHIPVILFSANADIRNIYLRANADDYIEKPFEIETLLQKIKQFL